MFIISSFSACNRVLDIKPKDVVNAENAFEDIASFKQALNRIYRRLTSSSYNMQLTDYATDDFEIVTSGFNPVGFYVFNWDYTSQPQPSIWRWQYNLISETNVILSNAQYVIPQSGEERQQKAYIVAQAKAIRAWCHFNIVMLYANRYNMTNNDDLGIPIKLKLDREDLPRSPLQAVYKQIFLDIDEALTTFEASTLKLIESDKPFFFGFDATKALEARVALFIGDLKKAKEASSFFITRPLLSKDNYWKIWEDDQNGNQEFIFLADNLANTGDALLIDYHEIYLSNNVKLASKFVDDFDTSDIRLSQVNNYNPNKYIIEVNERNPTEKRDLYYKFFRLAEQYLIFSEASLNDDVNESLRVFNLLRIARGLSNQLTPLSLKQVLEERRKELFCEGLRFYDLKRLANRLDITVKRNENHFLSPDDTRYIWKIPVEEINANPFISE